MLQSLEGRDLWPWAQEHCHRCLQPAGHALDAYLESKPSYNNEAHTFGYTYRDGTLKLYATHVIEPPKPERNSQGYFQRQLMLLLMAQLELRFQATGISFAGHRRGAAKRGGVMHHSEVLFLAL